MCTLDGRGTFDGMGIISMTSSTSAANLVKGHFTEEPLKRLARVKVGNMIKGKGIPLVHYRMNEKSALSEIQFQTIAHLNVQYTVPRSVGNVHVLWHAGWFLPADSNPRWNWSGFMQTVTTGESSHCVDIRVLPIIDNDELSWEHRNCYGGSGLVGALECCYGSNSVAQMIAGKVVSRAIHGHFLRHIMGISLNQVHGEVII